MNTQLPFVCAMTSYISRFIAGSVFANVNSWGFQPRYLFEELFDTFQPLAKRLVIGILEHSLPN